MHLVSTVNFALLELPVRLSCLPNSTQEQLRTTVMDLERGLHLNNTFSIENQQFIVDRLKEAVGSSSALLTEMGLYIHYTTTWRRLPHPDLHSRAWHRCLHRAITIILHRQRTVQPRRVSWPRCRGHVSHQNLRVQCVGVLRDGVCVKGATLMEINAFSFWVAVLFEVHPATAVLTYQVPAAYYGNWYGYTLLKYMRKVALTYHSAPHPRRGGRGEMAMAVVAWLHVYGVHQMLSLVFTAHEVFYFKGASSTELPATTEERWRRRHSSQGHKAGPSAILHVSLCRVSFKGANPHSGWRALGQLEPVRRSRTRVHTDTPREVTRKRTRAQSRTALRCNRPSGRRMPQRGRFHKQLRDTRAARAPSRVTAGSRPKNCIFWRYPPYADVRLNLDLDGDVSATVRNDDHQYLYIDFCVPEIARLMRTF